MTMATMNEEQVKATVLEQAKGYGMQEPEVFISTRNNKFLVTVIAKAPEEAEHKNISDSFIVDPDAEDETLFPKHLENFLREFSK